MTKFKVVVTDFLADELVIENQVLGDICDITAACARRETDLIGKVEDADALMVYHEISLSADIINRLRKCKIIVRCGVGIDNVDGIAARARGIDFTNVPDYGTEEVADSAIGMLLALTRGLHYFNSLLQRSQGPWHYSQAVPLRRLRNQVIGLVGFGRIAIATAKRAQALGMSVIFYDPFVPDGMDKAIGVSRVNTLDLLLSQSYVVSVHCPLTTVTNDMINAAAIATMPVGSYLINTARGAIVNEGDLLAAIESGHLSGAGIDVLATEPPSGDEPILRAWRDPYHPAAARLIINPHAAFYCEEGLEEMRRKGSDAVRRALTGGVVRNVVN